MFTGSVEVSPTAALQILNGCSLENAAHNYACTLVPMCMSGVIIVDITQDRLSGSHISHYVPPAFTISATCSVTAPGQKHGDNHFLKILGF